MHAHRPALLLTPRDASRARPPCIPHARSARSGLSALSAFTVPRSPRAYRRTKGVCCAHKNNSYDHDKDPATPCKPCGPGNVTNSVTCSPCLAGYFDHDRSSRTPCQKCKAGSSSGPLRISCPRCAAGTYAAEGASACTKCTRARPDHDHNPTTECEQCNNGQRAGRDKARGLYVGCRACPANQAAGVGGVCACKPGYYNATRVSVVCAGLGCRECHTSPRVVLGGEGGGGEGRVL